MLLLLLRHRSLVEFCAEPELMVDLYCNYDLDLGSSNLFEKLTAFLAANMFSDTGRFNSLHRLCLEALLAVVESVAQMFCHPENSSYATLLQDASDLDAGDDDLAKTKAEKKKLAQAADQWNKNKKKSLGTLASMGMIASATDPTAIATFFRNTPGLDLDSLGEYFGKISDKFNQSVFAEFVKTFNFEGHGLDMALRTFLESFKLPGEAQQVSTILEAFAARFYEHNKKAASNEDTIFILSFSIIMLNTDLHNDGVKNKMTIEEFVRNNRGIDDGKDLPVEFLESIYNEILRNEIKMTPDAEKLDAEEMDDKQWEQLLRSGSNSQISSGGATLAVGRDMFALIWNQVVSAMCMSLDTTSPIHNERMVYKVLSAFEHVVHIASFFKQPDILNNAIVSLCKSLRRQTELLAGLIERAGPAAAFRDSTSKKTLQIVQALFKIVHANYTMLQDAWLNIIECVVLLNRGRLSLLPTDLTDVDDFYDASGKPLASSVSQLAAAQQQRTPGGEEELSFLSLFYPPEEEEIEQKRAADQEAEVAMRATVATCNISGIFVASKTLSEEALPHLVNALLQCTGHGGDGNGGSNGGGEGGVGGSRGAAGSTVFNEELLSQIYCLEWLTNVCRHNQFRMDVLWPLVSSFFQSGLAAVGGGTGGTGKHRLFLERIVVSILRLCCYFEENHIVSSPRGPRSPVDTLFATLRPICATLVPGSAQGGSPPPPSSGGGGLQAPLPEAVVLALGSRVTAGLLMLLRSNGSMLREPASWEMVFDICQRYAQQPTSQQCALESLHYVITNHPELYVGPGARFMKVLLNVAGTASKASPVERSHTLVDSLFHMHETLGSTLPRPPADTAAAGAANANASAAAILLSEEEWAERWVQTLVWVATQCLDPRPDAHNYAATTLHKALFSSTVPTPPVAVLRRTFDEVLYLLLPQIVNHSRTADDMRVKSFNLLSQFFLHNMTILRTLPQPNLDEFLAGYLSFTRQYMSGNHDTTVLDSICDILRNTMMVMSVEGLLASVPVWSEATTLLEQFVPDLKHSLQPGGSPFAAVEAEAARVVAEAAASKLAAEQEAAHARHETEVARRSLQEMQNQQQVIAAQQQRQAKLLLQQVGGGDGGGGSSPASPGRGYSREDLSAMKVSALQKLAAKKGVDEDTIDDCMEADRPKDALIELLLARLPPPPQLAAPDSSNDEAAAAVDELPPPPPPAPVVGVGGPPPGPPPMATEAPPPPPPAAAAPPQPEPEPEPEPDPSQLAALPPPPPPAQEQQQQQEQLPPPPPPLAAAAAAATAVEVNVDVVQAGVVAVDNSSSSSGGGVISPPATATAAVAVAAVDVQLAPPPPPSDSADSNGQPMAVAVTAVAAAAPEAINNDGTAAAAVATEAEGEEEEEEEDPYPTGWGALCNALCDEFPQASRTDVIGAMGRNDNVGKRAAEELRAILAEGAAGAGGMPQDDPEYAASHGVPLPP